MLFAQSATGSLNIPRAVEFPYLANGLLQSKPMMKKSPGTSCSPFGLGYFSCFHVFVTVSKGTMGI